MKKHEIENEYVIHLVQAMTGFISNNFFAVWLKVSDEKPGKLEEKHVEIFFQLKKESKKDRDNIEEIIFDLEALTSGHWNFTPQVVIQKNVRDWQKGERIIFLKDTT